MLVTTLSPNSSVESATPVATIAWEQRLADLGPRVLLAALMMALLWFNYRLWIPDNQGIGQVHRLQAGIAAQQAENRALEERNHSLEAEVQSLRQGVEAIEERARVELGMILENETFFRVLDEPPPLPVTGR